MKFILALLHLSTVLSKDSFAVTGQLFVNRTAHGDTVSFCHEIRRKCMETIVSVSGENITCVSNDFQNNIIGGQQCIFYLAPNVNILPNIGLAVTIKSGKIHNIHNNTHHIAGIFLTGTRNNNCTLISLEVIRGDSENMSYPIDHSGFSINQTEGSIGVDKEQLGYSFQSYEGELYRMGVRCPNPGCLYFKLSGTAQLDTEKFNNTVPGISQMCTDGTVTMVSPGPPTTEINVENRDWVIYVSAIFFPLFLIAWVLIIFTIILAKKKTRLSNKIDKKLIMIISHPDTKKQVNCVKTNEGEPVTDQSGKDISMSVANPNYVCTV